MSKKTQHHGTTTCKSPHEHQGNIDIAVLSGERGPDDHPQTDVTLQIYSGCILTSFSITPAAARELACRLAEAAVAAETPDAEIIDFTLARHAA